MKRRVISGLLLLALCIPVAACGNDAPVQSRDRSGAIKLNMPDEFDTIAGKCDGQGHWVVESQNHDGKASGIAVVADKRCEGRAGVPTP